MENNTCDTEKVMIERERLAFLRWLIPALKNDRILEIGIFLFALSFFLFSVVFLLKEGGLLAP